MKIIKRHNVPNKKTLSNLIEIGRTKKKASDDLLVSFITMSDITHTINNKEDRFFKDVKKGYTYFENGDVLVAKITPCFENGKGCMVKDLTNDIGFGSTEFFVLKDVNNLGISEFVKYVTQQNSFRYNGSKKMVGSGGQRRVPKDFILNYPIIDIDNDEYKLISSVLSLQEKQIENVKDLMKKIETRNQYYAEKILSGELRVIQKENGNIGFYNNIEWKDAFLNGNNIRIPLSWSVRNITDIMKTKKGSSLKSDLLNYSGNGTQYLRTNEVWDESSVNKDKVYFDGDVTSFTTKNKSEYIICFDGFNNKPNLGTVGMVTNNGDGICSGELHKIQELEGVSKYYVNIMMLKNNRFQELICRNAEGSTVKHAGKHFKNIEEVLIPIKEQELLNEVFKNQLQEIDSLKSLLEKEQLRFQWLLDNLLSGEYQVVKD